MMVALAFGKSCGEGPKRLVITFEMSEAEIVAASAHMADWFIVKESDYTDATGIKHVSGKVDAFVLRSANGLPTLEFGPTQVATTSLAGRMIEVGVTPLTDPCATLPHSLLGKLEAAGFKTVDGRSTAEHAAKSFEEKRAFELESGRRHGQTMNFTVTLRRADALAHVNLIANLADAARVDEATHACAISVRILCCSISTGRRLESLDLQLQ